MINVFSQAVNTAPDAIAFILSSKEKISYATANQYVSFWANYLLHLGVSEADRVGLLTAEEDRHPFVHLAVSSLNATIVPLDTDIPSAQLELDLAKLNLKILLVDAVLCSNYKIPDSIKVTLETSGVLPPFCEALVRSQPIHRDAGVPNYIVASSGVSGNKKWIPIGSEGLDYWASIERSLLHLGQGDKILCTRSPAYDARISEYVRAFAMCSTLVLLSQSQRRDFNAIVECCEQEKIGCIILIASQLGINQESLIARFAQAGLIHLLVTGDACSPGLKKLCEKYNINLWNCYGPTEATFGMSLLRVNGLALHNDNGHEVVPIGLPHTAEVKHHIIDGCLYIESPYLSVGYLDDDERTQKNFPTLLINNRQIRFFNTENRFLQQDEYLVFQGRIDSNAHCKVSGVKVEPYAIQQCLEKFNEEMQQQVLQAHVVVKLWLEQPKPFAYLLITQEFNPSLLAVYLKKWLRKEEMPLIIVLDHFPRLKPSEKIDSRFLIERTDKPEEFFFKQTAPVSDNISDGLMQRLTVIWKDILGLSQADNQQEFMFVGGDSFQLNRLLFRIKEEIDPAYSYQQLINLPSITLLEIANSLRGKPPAKSIMALVKPLYPPDANKENYFFLPPLLGEGYFTYRELARIFCKQFDYNVYGLSDPSVYNIELIPKTLKEAAGNYVRAIRSIQPEGPYYLLGFSYGGILAHYVAQELIAQGELINGMHLVDGFPPALYQKLSAKDHATLLEELIGFVIQTLNNRYYNEQLKPVRLTRFHLLKPEAQISNGFDFLKAKVKKPQSQALLALAEQHLLLMLEEKEPVKLPISANLYLSTPNQCYLNVIFKIQNIVKQSADCQYYFWNHYVHNIVLEGTRVNNTHLGLLKPKNGDFGNSVFAFWERSKDTSYYILHEALRPNPFYYVDTLNENQSIVYMYSLEWQSLKNYKAILTQYPIDFLHHFPLYEKISQTYERKNRGYAESYCLTFQIHTEKLEELFILFHENKIAPYSSSLSLKPVKVREKKESFAINIDFYWHGSFLISLYFRCHSENQPLIELIMSEMKLYPDHFKGNCNLQIYNYTQHFFDMFNPSVFNAIDQISDWLNQFILLLLPHIESSELQSRLSL